MATHNLFVARNKTSMFTKPLEAYPLRQQRLLNRWKHIRAPMCLCQLCGSQCFFLFFLQQASSFDALCMRLMINKIIYTGAVDKKGLAVISAATQLRSCGVRALGGAGWGRPMDHSPQQPETTNVDLKKLRNFVFDNVFI